jgi:hypothetical protein
MSADNWTTCPRCQRQHDENVAKAQEKADAAYGKVSVSEFDRLREAAQKLAETPPKQNMREDYDIGFLDGTFWVDFRASCDCGFRFEFKHSEEHDAKVAR